MRMQYEFHGKPRGQVTKLLLALSRAVRRELVLVEAADLTGKREWYALVPHILVDVLHLVHDLRRLERDRLER